MSRLCPSFEPWLAAERHPSAAEKFAARETQVAGAAATAAAIQTAVMLRREAKGWFLEMMREFGAGARRARA